MPAWVESGYADYANRLPRECRLELHEISLARRGKNAVIDKLIEDEGERMLAAIPSGAYCIALAVEGRAWDTSRLAQNLADWLQAGRDLALLIGGPDGLAQRVLARADLHWSLSPLTLPHALVRIVVAEQLYRAWSLLNNHPYHRA